MGFDLMIADYQIAQGQVSHGSQWRSWEREWTGPWCGTQPVRERPHLLLEAVPLSSVSAAAWAAQRTEKSMRSGALGLMANFSGLLWARLLDADIIKYYIIYI